MPQLKIESEGTFDVREGRRLVNAISDCGVDIGHRCGGKARCTTCRVRFTAGEPDLMTVAEYEKLKAQNLLGEIRLSCQILADHDMAVEVLMRARDTGWTDCGPEPSPVVEPDAAFYPIDELAERTAGE